MGWLCGGYGYNGGGCGSNDSNAGSFWYFKWVLQVGTKSGYLKWVLEMGTSSGYFKWVL